MPTFDYSFTVRAPRQAVTAFHHDTSVLKKLSPPPIFIQLHRFEPLAEGSEASFTMWVGPIPLRWRAIHSDVGPEGFTDTQVSGPLARWQHTHRFTPLDEDHTRVEETIHYEHAPGLRGRLTRLLFNRPGLTLLFTYRQLATRWGLRRRSAASPSSRPVAALAVAAAALLLLFSFWRKRSESRARTSSRR